MIRLAVSGVDEWQQYELAKRVHRALLVPASHEFDAVAYIGTKFPGLIDIERLTRAGKAVLLATDAIPSGDQLEYLLGLTAARVVLVNPDRLIPSRQLIHDELHGAKFGAPGLVRSHRWEPTTALEVNSDGVPSPVVNDLDLVLWLMHSRPNVLFATKQPNPTGSGFSLLIHLGFDGGGMALIDYSNSLLSGDSHQSLSVIAASGAMYADDHPNCQLLFRSGGVSAVPASEGLLASANLIQQFVNSLSTNQLIGFDRGSWQRLKIVTNAVCKSLDTGRAISLRDH